MQQFKVFNQDIGAPPPPPQPGFGTTPPPPPPPQGIQSDKASSRAIWALVLGIASWTICPTVIPAIIAWIMGKKEIREIDEGRAPAAGRTMAQIGMWLGIVNIILYILAIIGIIIYFVVIVAIIGSSN